MPRAVSSGSGPQIMPSPLYNLAISEFHLCQSQETEKGVSNPLLFWTTAR